MGTPNQFDYEERYKQLRAERKRLKEAEEAKRKQADDAFGRECAMELIHGVLSDIREGNTERFSTERGQEDLQLVKSLGYPF